MHKNGININSDKLVEEYCILVNEAIDTCVYNNKYFYDNYISFN